MHRKIEWSRTIDEKHFLEKYQYYKFDQTGNVATGEDWVYAYNESVGDLKKLLVCLKYDLTMVKWKDGEWVEYNSDMIERAA